MKRTLIAMFAICAVLGINYSCKKPKSETPLQMVTGKWVMIKSAMDMNGNGVADPDEVFSDSNSHYFTFFNSDGTGISTDYNDTDSRFTWSFEYNNTYLKVTENYGYVDIRYLQISSLSSSGLILKDTTGGGATWAMYAKR